jgi:NADPH-dependent 2,4-dienoyl-CoA reductase/sulfur reductase-like enzyme
MELADCLRIATKLSGDGLVDFIGVLGGQAENLPAHADIFPNMAMPTAPYLYLASAIKANVGVPVFHAQRITDLATADRAIRAGHVDMVAMTRAHIADPHIMRKLMEGRADDIRPCIGANYCIDRLYSGGQAYCLHNAATGRENTMPHVIARAPQRKRAVVVGAGPAGLEAARVLASRGHEVTVFEKRPRVGGQLQTAARVAWRESLLNIPRWLEAQARKNGATIHLGTEVDAAGVLACDPDVVILATGGEPAYAPFDGSTFSEPLANAIDTGCLPGQRILVFDDNGAEGAVSSCEYFAKQGASVEYVTADPQVAPLLERTTRPVFMRRAYELGVKFRVDTRLERVFSDGGTLVAVLRNEYTRETEELRVDRVVVDYGVLSDGTLYKALRPHSTNLGEVDLDVLVAGQPQTLVSNAKGRFGLFRIGDAVSSRNVHAAVYDALRLCKDL